MGDTTSRFLEKFAGQDSEVLSELDAARERSQVGRQIHLLRKDLKLSRAQFAEILGLATEDDVETLELGNFEESGLEKLAEVDKAVREWMARRSPTESVTVRASQSARRHNLTTAV
jgi:transcriptional regulator with XRE-family HTH domain